MTHFYDPGSMEDLERVEKLLRGNGIEYALAEDRAGGIGWLQIEVAEEDVPRAEELIEGLHRRA